MAQRLHRPPPVSLQDDFLLPWWARVTGLVMVLIVLAVGLPVHAVLAAARRARSG